MRVEAPTSQSGVALRCVGVTAWSDAGPYDVDLRGGAAVDTGEPVWVQFALPWLDTGEQAWFEGSVDPWEPTGAPPLDWSEADHVLDLLGVGRSELDEHEQRLLDRLPQLYGRGVARVVREVWGRQAYEPSHLRFFPTVAFQPIDGSDPPRFTTLRMTVGVIRNVVISVRLPDLGWDDASEGFEYEPGGRLTVAPRFFPVADDLTADDVAEAIGLHQASTARAVSESVAAELRKIERKWRHDVGSADGRRNGDSDDASRVVAMTEHLYQLDRQLARLLRRCELDRSASAEGSIAAGIAIRYRYALDELRSLEGNCRLTAKTINQAIVNAESVDRERFHFVAAALTTSILVPTLVASIYGANVALPAKNSWQGFIALILFILAFALIGVFAISKAFPHESMTRLRWLGRLPVQIATPVLATAAMAGGVVAVV